MDKKILLPERIDYDAVGFKCGLEIHRRFRGKKLFCGCDAHAFEKDIKEEGRVVRELRVSISEEGRIDQAALYEFKKRKYYEYMYYKEGTCLVELDEQPPYPPNPDLIKKALRLAVELQCNIPNEIIFMRKIVVDGSNTSGFQRTALIGINGKLNDHVGIESICLEEESAQIVERTDKKDVYDLRRLGIGLIEIATTPTIKNSHDAYNTAKQLGDLLKYSFYFQRGLGSIRQDLNISIKEGARVEIKGVQDLELIPKIVEYEVMRQLSLINFKNSFYIKASDFSELKEVSHLFVNSESKLFKGKEVWMFSIANAKGVFGLLLNPVQTLGNEIANYVKAVTKAKGFIHSDENLMKYKIEKDVKELIDSSDLYVFIIGNKALAENVRSAIMERVLTFMERVPEETRRALDNGATAYLRPLPGAARMYPETDVVPINVNTSLLNEVSSLPFFTYDKLEAMLKKHISNKELLKQILNSHYLDYVVEHYEEFKENLEDVAKLLLTEIKGKEREFGFNFMRLLPESHEVVVAFLQNKLAKEGVSLVLRELNEGKPLSDLLQKYRKKDIAEILKEVENLNFKDAMRLVREKYEGIVNIGEVAKALQKVRK